MSEEVKLYDAEVPIVIHENGEVRITMSEAYANSDRSYPVAFNVAVEMWTSTDALGTVRWEHAASFGFVQASDGRITQRWLDDEPAIYQALGSLVADMAAQFLGVAG